MDTPGGYPYKIIPINTKTLSSVQFESNSSKLILNESLIREMSTLAALIKSRGYDIEIQGHTDNSSLVTNPAAAENQNRILSQSRADAVRDFLLKRFKVRPDMIRAVGYGQDFPIADNNTEEGRAMNRRVTVKIRN